MPEGVNVEVDEGYARISFPDPSKQGPALSALLKTGAPIQVKTGGVRREYLVPEGNAREAGLLDAPKKAPAPAPEVKTPEAAAPAEAPVKKAPAKKAAPVTKEASDGESESGE
jgi:hypothetical protein